MNGKNPGDNDYQRAEDLGPSHFDPHAPYTPVEPHSINLNPVATDSQDKNLALMAHLLGCLGALFGSVLGFAGPLIIWLTHKSKSAFVEQQAREALNFQITLLILTAVCSLIVSASCWTLFPLLFLPVVLQVIFGIIATISVSRGNAYRYPFNIRLIK